ncbi:MAG: ECF-type sigma factor [Blastocatellia bacterium]
MDQDIAPLLLKWKNGDKEALNHLIPIVYDQLHKLASKYLSQERDNHTLQTTALVNEAYLRLVKVDLYNMQTRAQFVAIAARVMRNILIDYARKNVSGKRPNPKNKIALEDVDNKIALNNLENDVNKGLDLVSLDKVLSKFALVDKQQSQIVELRFFAGLNIEETAEVMELLPNVVKQKWQIARLWLLRELKKEI